jgi:hypothetical protein
MFLTTPIRWRWVLTSAAVLGLAPWSHAANPRLSVQAAAESGRTKTPQLTWVQPSRAATRPTPPQPQVVTLRAPDGSVRTFRLEGPIVRTFMAAGRPHVTVTQSGGPRTFALEGQIIRVQPAESGR